MKSVKIKNEHLTWAIAALCISFLILLWFNFYHQQRQDKKETIASAIQRNSNLAVALEQYAIRTIQNADAVLQLLLEKYKTEGEHINIEKLLFENKVNGDIYKGVAVIDAKGIIARLNLKMDTTIKIDVSDRDYFQYNKIHDTNLVFISKPVFSRTINKPVIILSRRITKNRQFEGVVALQFEPSTFTSFYAQANLRPHDIISLIAPDGTTYARRTGTMESSGENISKSPLFQHLANNPDSFYYAKDAIHDIPTWFSYRKLKHYPIIATVGTSEQDVLEEYYKRFNRDLTSTIIISFLIILFSLLASLLIKNKKLAALKQIEDQQYHQQELTKKVIAAQERERESIGHELHDNVNQILTTSKLYLEMTQVKKELTEDLVSKSIDLINSCINEIRNLSHRLSAPTLGTRSLVDSLSALAETVSSASGLPVEFEHSNYGAPLPMEQKLTFYRIAQEQLNNVLKHAQATMIQMELWQQDGNTFLRIQDNGKGFDTSINTNGIGINNMISRAGLFNGEVDIRSALNKGCTLTVSLPMPIKHEG